MMIDGIEIWTLGAAGPVNIGVIDVIGPVVRPLAVSVGQIQAEFPEFTNTDPALIGYKLADAERLVDFGFGPLRDDAVKYLACHLIALSPHGEQARLVESQEPGGATTTYERHYLLLKRSTVVAQMAV